MSSPRTHVDGIARRIYLARRDTGLSQVKFAEHIGVAERTVQSWELGERVPRLAQLGRISLGTGRPISWFFEGESAQNGEAA